MIKRFFMKIGETLLLFPRKQSFLLLSLLAFSSLVFQIYDYFSAIPAPASSQCAPLKTSIEQQITRAAHCTTDADCEKVTFNCPFACGISIHKNSDRTPLIKNIESYNNTCGFCVDECAIEPAPVCVNNLCQIKHL